MTVCAIYGCHSNSDKHKKYPNIKFHIFPSDPIIAARWTEKVRLSRHNSYWRPTKYTKICSLHFNDNDKYLTKGGLSRLRRSAVPSKNLYMFVVEEELDIHVSRDDALHREPSQPQPGSSGGDTNKKTHLKTPTKSIGIPVSRRPLKRGVVPSVFNKIEKQTLIDEQNLIKREKKQTHSEAVTETPEDDAQAELIVCRSPTDVILGENPIDVTLVGSPADEILCGSPADVILGESSIDNNSNSELKVVCRLCLVSNVKMFHLHSQPLGIYYENIIGVNLQSTTELPPYACYKCAALIKKFYHFKVKCSRGQTILYDMINNYGMITVQELQLVNRKKLLLSSNLAIQQLPEPIHCMHQDDFDNIAIKEEQNDPLYITIEVEGLTEELQHIDRSISSGSELTNLDNEDLVYSSSDDEVVAVHKNKEGKKEVNEHGMKKSHSKRKKSHSVDLSEHFEEVILKPTDDTIDPTSKLVNVKKRKCGRPWKKNTINAENSRLTENKEVEDNDAANSRLAENKEVDDDDADNSRLTENKEVDEDDAENSRLTD